MLVVPNDNEKRFIIFNPNNVTKAILKIKMLNSLFLLKQEAIIPHKCNKYKL